MTRLTPYLSFPGTARQALTFYQEVFGGELELNTLGDFGREDGPADAIAHGMLQGPVELFASDAGANDPSLRLEGVRFSLLGTADPATLETVTDPSREQVQLSILVDPDDVIETAGEARRIVGVRITVNALDKAKLPVQIEVGNTTDTTLAKLRTALVET